MLVVNECLFSIIDNFHFQKKKNGTRYCHIDLSVINLVRNAKLRKLFLCNYVMIGHEMQVQTEIGRIPIKLTLF